MLVGAGMVSLIAGFALGRVFFRGKEGTPAVTSAAAAIKMASLTMAMHHAGDPIVLQRDNDPNSDACILLSSCFPDMYFAARPDLNPSAPLSRCQRNLKGLLNQFDSGFLYEGARLVGFISSAFRDTQLEKAAAPAKPEIELYNVCIRSEDRKRGLAKPLLNLYLDQLAAANGYQSALVGLDVSFKTPSSKEAFTLYAKMGFVRWWQPCASIGEFDFSQLKRVPARFPAAWWFLNAQGVKQDKFGGMAHFCMVKAWPEDDFYHIASAMHEAINSVVQ
jgi:hypothetical protein